MRIRIRSFIALLTFAASSAAAQTGTDIPVGTRLRFTYRPLDTELSGAKARPLVARFARARGDTIDAVDAINGDTLKLPLAHFARVEMAASTYHPVAKAGIIGASLGLVAGAMYGDLHTAGTRFVCIDIARGCVYEKRIGGVAGALRWGGLGAVAGLGAGVAIGATMNSDRWVVVGKWRM